MRQVSGEAEYCSEMFGEHGIQTAERLRCDSHNMLGIHGTGADAGNPQANSMGDPKVVRTIEEFAETLIVCSSGLRTVLHVAVKTSRVGNNRTEIDMLVFDRHALFTSMDINAKVRLPRLLVGVVTSELLGVLANQLEKNDSLIKVDFHIKGFEGLKYELNVRKGGVEVRSGPYEPGTPNVVRKK